jgi:predicted GTPase
MAKLCNNCNSKTNLFFCAQCGTILEYPQYIENDKDRKREFREIIFTMINKYDKAKKEIDNSISRSILTDSAKKYFKKIATIEHLITENNEANKKYQRDDSSLFTNLEKFGKNCLSNECKVALVGTIKAGKSCLVNSILGRELASVDIVPETASLTKFRHTPQDTIKVTFYNQSEWEELEKSVAESFNAKVFKEEYQNLKAEEIKNEWLGREPIEISIISEQDLKEKIKIYSSATSAVHYFVKELEVGLKDFNIPPNVVFIDTPGLDDPIKYRSEITRKYLDDKTSVVLVCVKAKPIEGTELSLILKVFSDMRDYEDRVYILGTQYDKNGDIHNTWNEIKTKNWFKYLTRDFCYGSLELAENRVFPIAPYIYTMIKRYFSQKSFGGFIQRDKDDLENGINNFLKGEKQITEKMNTLEEFIEKYGKDEGTALYIQMLHNKLDNTTIEYRIDSNFDKLIELTNVNFFRQLLTDGPVKDADKIIIEDISRKYNELKNQIIENSAKIRNTQESSVKIGEEKDLKTKINDLSNQITQTKKAKEELEKSVKKMLDNIQEKSNKAINSIENNL